MSKEYSIEEVFNMLGEENLNPENVSQNDRKKDIIIDGYKVRCRSLRYMTFYQKGVRCACCGRMGTHFKLDGDEGTNRRHFNLYCDDGMLMTKDHIYPKSLGGLDRISNLQPMCAECNSKKGNMVSGEPISEKIKKTDVNGSVKYYNSFEDAIISILSSKGKIKYKSKVIKTIIDATDELRNAIKHGTLYRNGRWEIVKEIAD